MIRSFRPWGPLDWLVNKLPDKSWSLLGTLGTEDRCAAVHNTMNVSFQSKLFLKILDPHMSPRESFENRFKEIKTVLSISEDEILETNLLEDIDTIQATVMSFLETSSNQVILDISSMPKRWFFPVLRFILQDERIETLIVCYSVAGSYGDQLSSDPLPLGPIPTFDQPRQDKKYDDLIVGVGFAPLGLKDLFDTEIEKIRYLFPFPPGPPNYFRNWDFLRKLENEVKNRNLRIEDRWQVHTFDISNIFDVLCEVTQQGQRTSALAPFGPKTQSLAMCLFALAVERAEKEPPHVYYSQPKRYAIDYSTGVSKQNNKPDIKSYCIKLSGENLFFI